MRRALAAALGFAALLSVSPLLQAGGPLRICAASDNLPLSDDAPPRGMEVEFAQALAARLGSEARFVWQDGSAGASEQALLEGRCDAILGAVAGGSGTLARTTPHVPGIALTAPYYSAGYLLVRRAGSPAVRRLAELGDRRVAVEMVSVPIYTLKQRGHRVFAVDDHEAVIAAVADGRTDYGYVWGPVAQWELRQRRDVVVDERFEAEEWWDFAMAVREDDLALRRSLDAAIAGLLGSGETAPIFGRFVLQRPTAAARSGDAAAVRQQSQRLR